MLEIRNRFLSIKSTLIEYIQAQPETHQNGKLSLNYIPQCINEFTTYPSLSFSWGSGWDQVSIVNIDSLAKLFFKSITSSTMYGTVTCVQPPLACYGLCSIIVPIK